MVDPFSALSIAASVVQFIDFASRLLSKSNQIRKHGSAIDVEYLSTKTQDLILLSGGLRSDPGDASGFQDEALNAIAKSCADIADLLIRSLSKLSKNKSKISTWTSIRLALKSIWNEDQIEALSKQLDGYRQQLALRLLVILNAKYDKQNSESANRLDLIETSNQRIVEIVTFTQSLLETAIASGSDEIDRLIERYARIHGRGDGEVADESPSRLCEEAFSAILTLADGTTRTIADLSRTSGKATKSRKKRDLHRLTTFRNESRSLDGGEVSVNEFAPLAQEVMLILQFRMIHVRIESVAEVHTNTFRWIFEETRSAGPGENFVEWLRKGNGIYWVNGKAGSGKSTLMKSVVLNKDTKSHLQSWAGNQQLTQASFFFWSPGTQLQKSLEGLLRALLADLLKQCPYLIPNVFPDLCRQIAAGGNSGRALEYGTSLVELKSAFRKLLKHSKGIIKICLFIDGLDEYSGDLADICAFFIDISTSPGSPIKLVISSRPWVVISDAFQRFPGLRLQDLTRPDIELYVSDKLNGNSGMKALIAWQPTVIADFSALICERASGVFLWVVLAVRSLLDGLTYGDRISELYERLESLPTDLRVFYTQIIESMEPRVQKDAARTFMIMLRSTEVQGDNPIELLQLALADDADTQDAVKTPMKALPQPRRAALCEIMRRRIDVRSRGLLEIHGRSSISIVGASVVTDYVEFLHRTVVDFLRTTEMWELLSTLAGASFDPHQALLSSCIMEAKVLPIEPAMLFSSDLVMGNMRQALSCASALELSTLRPCTVLLDELEKTVNAHWDGTDHYKLRSRSESWASCRESDWCKIAITETGYARTILKDVGQPFIRLAIDFGCVLYAAEKITNRDGITEPDKQALLLDVVTHYFQSPDEDKSNHTSVIQRLLPLIDLRERHNGWSVWCEFLHQVSLWLRNNQKMRLQHTVQVATEVSDIFLYFLEAGALRHATFDMQIDQKTTIAMSATKVIEELRDAVSNPEKSAFSGEIQEINDFHSSYVKIRSLLREGDGQKHASSGHSRGIRRGFRVWCCFGGHS
ncbi:hypothetical protein BDV96DRAFT_526639 [Lophiotrema nucula]|uniref:NACHT domain-containing protein n=1 Tax=Lophiotrema nucula TaxID=690887 RepID=A0A6A5YZJ2_9PLEO|nr:hypothetical protein BDV96DRAFT_526639 [Lophiotrema nucula]